MQTTFEKLGGNYRQEGDHLLRNIEVLENPQMGVGTNDDYSTFAQVKRFCISLC